MIDVDLKPYFSEPSFSSPFYTLHLHTVNVNPNPSQFQYLIKIKHKPSQITNGAIEIRQIMGSSISLYNVVTFISLCMNV
jgi:hypothetical protein